MDKQDQAVVLENLRGQIANRWPQVVAELRGMDDIDLGGFLEESGLELSDVLRRGQHSWTELRRTVGRPTPEGSDREVTLLKRLRAVAHVDDHQRASAYSGLLKEDAPTYASMSPVEQQLAQMLFFSLWPDGGGHGSINEGLTALRAERAFRDELSQVVDLAFNSSRRQVVELSGPLAQVPLQVHARYQREEVLGALGFASLSRRPNSFREGVRYVQELNVDALFVTLTKSEADYSPTTLYRDYPISPTLFHWESQSTASVASPTGQRYVTGSSQILLFVRDTKSDEFGTAPYLFLGPARHVQHTGERPIAITWRLDRAMPADFFSSATVAAG